MSIQSLRSKFTTIFLMLIHKELLIALYFILFILGLNIGITTKFYNEFRVVEIVLLLGFGFYGLFNKQVHFSIKELFFFIFIAIGSYFWSNYQFVVVDLLVAYLLYKSFQLLKYNDLVTKIIIFASFLVFLLFPIALLNYINTGIYDPIWYPMPWNIRIYNSYFLILSIFAVWMYLTEAKYKNIYLIFIYLAFLSILLDAGRSAILAYTAFTIVICGFNRAARWKLLAVYAMTWFTYIILSHFASLSLETSANSSAQITRLTTSLRYDLWVNALQCWSQHPIVGCGFYQLDKHTNLAAHPHNLFIQILSETGIIGLSFLVFIMFFILKNINFQSKNIYFILAALLAVSIDMSLSGVHIYPVTQMALLWLFIFLLKRPEFSHTKNFGKPSMFSSTKKIFYIGSAYLMITFVFIYLFLNTTVFIESEQFTPPRFWEYGYQLL